MTYRTWRVRFAPAGPGSEVRVGQQFTLDLYLSAGGDADGVPLLVPEEALEVVARIDAPGFHLVGDHLRCLPAIKGSPAQEPARIPVTLVPLVGGTARVSVAVYADVQGAELIPAVVSLLLRVRPSADPVAVLDRLAGDYPVPEVILFLTLWGEGAEQRLQVYFTCPELEKEQEFLGALPLSAGEIAALAAAAAETAGNASGGASHGKGAHLYAFGASLFDRLFPPQSLLRERYWQVATFAALRKRLSGVPTSWLIVSDERALAIPWELVCPYRDQPDSAAPLYEGLLGETYLLAHWIGHRGLPLRREVPVGRFELSGEPGGGPEAGRWREALRPPKPCVEGRTRRGFSPTVGRHYLRCADRVASGGIAPEFALEGALDVARARWSG